MDPTDALMNVISGGVYSLGAAGINAGVSAVNGYDSNSLYPFQYGSAGYATPYSLGMTPAAGSAASSGLGGLLLIGAVVWLLVR